MRKIFFFLESLSGGGAEKVLSDIVCNLNSEKYDITVCTVVDGGIYQKKVEDSVKYKSFLKVADYKKGGWSKFLYCLKMKFVYVAPVKWVYRYFVREKYDIEIAFIEGYATKFIASSKNSDSKKIAWIHSDLIKNPYTEKYYKSIKAERENYKKFDKIECVSQNVKKAFEKKFSLTQNVQVQYNPVDSNAIKKYGKKNITIEINAGIKMVTVGRLEKQKGYIRLLECLGRLKEEGFKFSLWVIGEGSQRAVLENIIEKYQMKDYVQLIGFKTNPYKYVAKSDIFICPSYAEGFSTAATEAIILGKPVFTTDCAGMKELFGEECCGQIIPNTDNELYTMLKELVSGQIKPEKFQEAVQKRSRTFDIKKRILEIEHLLDMV